MSPYTPTFGVELEFFLLDSDGWPVIGAAPRLLHLLDRDDLRFPAVAEYSSFQIELNPGPWPLSADGLEIALEELESLVTRLRGFAARLACTLCTCALVPRISEAILTSPRFLSPNPRYRAIAKHFAPRQAVLEFEDGTDFTFPGDSVTGCLNEIHMTVQLENDDRTIAFFNYLNVAQEEPCRPYRREYEVNGKRVARTCTTMTLFTEANGELDSSGTLRRVGFLPFPVSSVAEYRGLVDRFAPIANDSGSLPDANVYFWVRLRDCAGALRAEYRPMDMAADWRDRVKVLAEYAIAYKRGVSVAARLDTSARWTGVMQ